MADPNLPPDMQPPRRKKQLPSLQPPGAGLDEPPVGSTGSLGDSKPRRPKKLPAMEGAPAEPDPAALAGSAARPPRRKKRQPAAAGGPDVESSPDHGTAPISAQQQLLPPPTTDAPDEDTEAPAAGRPRRKRLVRRQPTAAAAAAAAPSNEAADEEARRSPEGREADASAAAAVQQPAVNRTRHIEVEGMPLANVLETVREDVVTKGDGGRVNFGADLTDGGVVDEDVVGAGGGRVVGDSNMSDTIYWQTQDARTFKAEKMDKYQQRLDQERIARDQYLEGVVEEDTSNQTLKCAIGFTKVYNYIGTVLLGLMPGFAILHTVYVWSLSSGYLTFLADYISLASPMPILYYVVLTLILLSVLDRYDTGKLDQQSCLECGSFRHAGMVVLLYIPAYVVSNAMYPTDQWIRRYAYNSTSYVGLSNGDSLVQSWRVMDAVRAACLVLGWLVVAFNPQFNKLAANLETELDDLIGEDQRLEMGTTAARTMGTGTAKGVTMA